MKVTWVLLLALGVVSADVGLGYHYRVPQTSYGVPSYQYQSSGQHNTGYQAGNVHSASNLGSGLYQSSSSSSAGNIVQPTYQQNVGTGFQNNYESSSQYTASAVKNYQQYYQVQQQPTQVFKHFYVHAAPEEREEVRPRTPIVLPAPQKHYKIIFVKTPSEYSRPNVIAPVQPQSEEKTIVYVLVKKPEDQQDVVLPKIEQKPPSKPEVYFIKYKNKEDSQAVINNIVQDYNKGQPLAQNSAFGESSYQSGLGNVNYQVPAQQEASTGSFNSLGSQTYTLSSATANSGSDLSESIGSSISSPVTVSSTSSSANYDGSAISTSQGVPHETYGIPKFRVN